MLNDPTFECSCSEALLDAVGSFDHGEQGFLMWECVQSSVLLQNFFISEAKNCQKRLRIIRSILL